MENMKNTQYDETQIQVLEGLEAVRKRPGMYIGSTSARGLHHLVYEIVDNSIDEALAGYCTEIEVILNADDSVTVRDNGRGIPHGIHPKMGISTIDVVFTVLHAGGKFGGGGYKVSGGLHGVGASVVNALSTHLEVRVCDGEDVWFQSYHRGVPDGQVHKIDKGSRTGTEITFWADGEIFEETVYDYDTLLKRLREQAFLNGGLKIIFTDNRKAEPVTEMLHYEGGIKNFVSFLFNQKKERKDSLEYINEDVIYVSGEKNGSVAEVALQWYSGYEEVTESFANNIATTEGGTHVTGFKAALTKVLIEYAKKFKILKDNEELTGEDVREGLIAVISVKLEEPQFEGQTKTKLGNSEIRGLVENILKDKLSDYLEENPQVGRAVLEKALTASRARIAARKAREATRKTPLGTNSLPGKLTDCIVKDPTKTEIYIVEGDSAGGSAKSGRDSRYQAILPLWGKMLNVEKARADKVYGNDKLTPVIQALGTGIAAEFNIEKLRYDKIVIMADADVDGAHIQTLLLTFFFRFMRPLIEAGHIYLAKPPLYKLTRGKRSKVAFSDEERDMISEEFKDGDKNAKVDISRYKGLGEMNPEELWETTMDPKNRVLLKVTLDDAEKADRIFSVLMGDEVEPRRIFIEENAQYVTNLDV
ncbi:MAG: DNA topoisomerase (ATP-hydrolyzing) subunit B [Ruminococcaceae bacterium]|nr:DNA topoisomerase (ATP-hydrolyzing) subunit B [Oscillospiraceae bacterium]